MKYEIKSVLFLGVGGVSMHQLAIAFKDLGIKVFGYDAKQSEYTKLCEEKGILVSNKFCKSFLNVDIIIKTAAIKENNKFVVYAKKHSIKIVDRAEALSWLCTKFKNVIAVAGTHGKSTTATLIYEMLRLSGYKVSCHIGADVFAPRFKIGDDFLVVEACEYNKSFMSLFPNVSVITNVEAEHMDSYKTLFNLKNCFATFLKRAKTRFVFDEPSTRFLKRVKNVKFVAYAKVNPKLKGEHNLKNVSLAMAVAQHFEVPEKVVMSVVESFSGLPRRYEFIGMSGKSKIFVDYAHHPTEVSSFVNAFKSEFNQIQIVFQPHTYSRTKNLLKEFLQVLAQINNLIIFKEYPAREQKSCGMTAKQLYEHLKVIKPDVKYCASLKCLSKNLMNLEAICFVGAGDINTLAKKIVQTY